MTSPRTTFRDPIAEGVSAVISGQLLDAEDAAIPLANLDALTLTVWDIASGTMIVDGRNVLNANGGTVDASGNVTIEMDPTDNDIQSELGPSSLSQERHIALIEWTYETDKQGRHEVLIRVNNMGQVST